MGSRGRAAVRLDDFFVDDEFADPSSGDTTSGTATARIDDTANFVALGGRGFVKRDIRGHSGVRPGDEGPRASLADVAELNLRNRVNPPTARPLRSEC